MTFEAGTRVHIVGVGGAGMSGLARLLHERGCLVSGSDAQDSKTLEDLASAGVEIAVGHDAGHGSDAAIVLWSPAVSMDNVELLAARRRGADLMPRSRVLAALAGEQPVVGLTGTHGKTTATSMMVHVYAAAQRGASWLLGAPVRGVGSNGHWGSGALVLEVDESFGTFREIVPSSLGLLNVESDHLDYYANRDALEAAFVDLVNRTTGPVVAWIDDPGARRVSRRAQRTTVTVGRSAADWLISGETLSRGSARFRLDRASSHLAIELAVTGAHNVANAAVVAALAIEIGFDAGAVERGLAAFGGAPRRFERIGRWRGAEVYEDYAHLPGEISATLAAARAAGYQHVTAVFQPHRVTRTSALADSFGDAFRDADAVIVTDIYSAGEANPMAITGEVIARAVTAAHAGTVRYAATFNDVVGVLAHASSTDIIVLLGAGDVGSVAQLLPGGLEA